MRITVRPHTIDYTHGSHIDVSLSISSYGAPHKSRAIVPTCASFCRDMAIVCRKRYVAIFTHSVKDNTINETTLQDISYSVHSFSNNQKVKMLDKLSFLSRQNWLIIRAQRDVFKAFYLRKKIIKIANYYWLSLGVVRLQ